MHAFTYIRIYVCAYLYVHIQIKECVYTKEKKLRSSGVIKDSYIVGKPAILYRFRFQFYIE